MTEAVLWQQVKEAIDALGGRATYAEIVDYVVGKCPGTTRRNALTEIFACTVNHPARIHYMAKEEGVANQPYDFLYQPSGRHGCVERYKPEKHGVWGNRREADGRLHVVRLEEAKTVDRRVARRLRK
ncbi:MAG: hypothetical protein ACC613_08910 [Synergistales bacterium]